MRRYLAGMEEAITARWDTLGELAAEQRPEWTVGWPTHPRTRPAGKTGGAGLPTLPPIANGTASPHSTRSGCRPARTTFGGGRNTGGPAARFPGSGPPRSTPRHDVPGRDPRHAALARALLDATPDMLRRAAEQARRLGEQRRQEQQPDQPGRVYAQPTFDPVAAATAALDPDRRH